MKYKILIVEDDPIIADNIKTYLERWGYQVYIVVDFSEVIKEFSEYSLALLDISLPFFNGYHWCNEIRKSSNIPIVFLSSTSENMNIVMAMNMGADDFIAKPFSLEVLASKITAILRRTYDLNNNITLSVHKELVLNMNDGTILYKSEKIDLTKNEYRILQTLLIEKGNIVSRDFLMEKLWETDSYIDDNTLTVNITRLRKKLKNSGLEDYIITKKGQGYMV